ncbi:MAG TPA: response regulator [Methanotrichaceae archaeon]|nr:response regulator [Methanotrichaceae archaeon]
MAELLSDALEELQTSLEELSTAEEEIYQQNEELAKSHKNLEAERQRYMELFDRAPDGYLVTDPEGNIQEANYAAAAMLSLSQDLLAGKPMIDFVTDADRLAFRTHLHLAQLRQVAKVSDWDLLLQPRVGASIPASISVSLVHDAKGQLTGLRWLLHDITARKKVDKARQAAKDILEINNRHIELKPFLKECVDYLKNFSGCAAVGIRILDREGNIPYQAYDGFSQSFFEMESPLSIKSDLCMCINVIKGETDPALPFYTKGGSFYMNGTTRFLATVSKEAKGETRNICNKVGYESVALIPIRLRNSILGLIHLADTRENMVPLYMVEVLEQVGAQMGVALDRVQVQQALMESEERERARSNELEAVLDTAPIAIWIAHDPLCHKITGNAYADQNIMQAPRGINVSSSALPGDQVVCYKVFRKGIELPPEDMPAQVTAATGKPVVDEELDLIFPDGRTVQLIESAVPLFDAEGRVRGAVIAGADVTELKMAEDELRAARDELEHRVYERTAELQDSRDELEVINEELQAEIEEHEKTERELLKAKDAAEEAVRAKAAFMANMSHELRTPMNAVIGMTSILLEEPMTPEHKDSLETIRNSGNALLALINDVLDFSKIGRENAELELQPFDLRRCVEEAIDLVAAKASEKGLDLTYTYDKFAPEAILGDPARLRQVLANLLSNAVKFTKKGEVAISVSSLKLEGGNYEIHFTVADTGIGIPHDQMDKLFLPFSQVESSLSRNYEGTGLGLAISKKLAEMMGGKIWVESKEGVGSIFHFTIKAETALTPEATPKRLPTGPQPHLSGKHVLIVDDNKTVRKILSHQVYSWGMMPMIAASGQEALSRVRAGGVFDIAILDLNMPDMNGITLAEEIRKCRRDLPMVALAPVGQRPPLELFTASLTKPIKPVQLYDTLTGILTNQPATDQPALTQDKAQAEPQAGVSTLRILLAEDNVSSQKVALKMLEKMGYRADLAASGVEVLQAIERQPYDLVLMDIKMPEMDGLEATRQIRRRWPAAEQPKVIAITAYGLEGDREKCLAAGMDGYISKPMKMNELEDALSKCREHFLKEGVGVCR